MMKLQGLNSKSDLTRRKILGWLGLGTVASILLNMLPMKKMVAKRIMRKSDEKISISLNQYAVKRNRKING